MTMQLTSRAFDVKMAQRSVTPPPLRASLRGRVFAVTVTLLLHAAILAGLILGAHVTAPKAPPSLMVHIDLAHPIKILQDKTAPPPRFQRPDATIVPLPELPVQTAPSPVIAEPQQKIAFALPAPTAARQVNDGEGRDNFLADLLARLNRVKHYPPAARQAHIQGVVMLHFLMDADGKILSVEVARSSGRPLLDAEALALVRRAEPLPALPADFPTPTLDALVPIEFSLSE